jgi:hypothetical protein
MTEKNVVPFNPLDKKHLGESVAQAMLRQPTVPMTELKRFSGAGIYAIYYHGSFPAYKAIAKLNSGGQCIASIYVGKAVPKGARKGGDLSADPGGVLFSRLVQHLRSLHEAQNLNASDFSCRFLVVDDIWIPLGESLLIAKLNPLWNSLVNGFGNHDTGKGRHEGLRPRWDVLHPGRAWAERCQPREETAEQIEREIRDYLRQNPPHNWR